jgi:DNA-directed RNA polymerase specialized sigma24 family protein
MPAATDGPPSTNSRSLRSESSGDVARRAVEAVWRIGSARMVGALARYTGDFGLAEDVAQEAVAEALVTWSRDGAPANPVGWLLATARRRAIDSFRRRSALDERYAMLAGQLAEGGASAGAVAPPGQSDDLPWDPDRVDDDVLALMFVACHPVLAPEARVALTLRAVGGLASEEIARAFLVPVPTVQARITRAEKTIAAAGVPFELPPSEERRERLGGVLSVLYVIFTEGSTETDWERVVLLYEALGRVAPSPVVELNRAVARRDGERTTAGAVHRGRAGRLRPPVRVVPAPERPRRAARPARPDLGGTGRAGARRPAVPQRSRAVGAAAQGGCAGVTERTLAGRFGGGRAEVRDSVQDRLETWRRLSQPGRLTRGRRFHRRDVR